jgi:hypothetical protein
MAAEPTTGPSALCEKELAALLDKIAALFCSEQVAALALPNDEIHREIMLPLLPAMLRDQAIRQHWYDKSASGFIQRLKVALSGPGEIPLWTASDFEIHVAASYQAGADARALADTLLSEESLREIAAAMMNAGLQAVWGTVPPAALQAEPAMVPGTPPSSAPVFFPRDAVSAKCSPNRTLRRIIRISGAGTFILRRGITAKTKAFRALRCAVSSGSGT